MKLNTNYAGFWIRLLAALVDTVILSTVLAVLYLGFSPFMSEPFTMAALSGKPFNILIMVITIALWGFYGATPGKQVLNLKIIDEKTGGDITLKQSVLRYAGFILAVFTLCLGIVWVAFDRNKKGLHDHLAGTVVIRTL